MSILIILVLIAAYIAGWAATVAVVMVATDEPAEVDPIAVAMFWPALVVFAIVGLIACGLAGLAH